MTAGQERYEAWRAQRAEKMAARKAEAEKKAEGKKAAAKTKATAAKTKATKASKAAAEAAKEVLNDDTDETVVAAPVTSDADVKVEPA